MDIFERILKASELYDDNRPGLNDGGMLVKPSADGSRPGYAKKNIGANQYGTFKTDKQTGFQSINEQRLNEYNKKNKFINQLVSDANAGDKYVSIGEIGEKVKKKFKLKNAKSINITSFPSLELLESRANKIDKVLRDMLISDKPLNGFWHNVISERTGVPINKPGNLRILEQSPTYNSIKDQGLDLLKINYSRKSFNYLHDFSLSDQLTKALEIAKGNPTYIGLGGEKVRTALPSNKIMEFALRSWNTNKGSKDGPVQFFDKNGKRITWEKGIKLPYKNVSFSYNGKIHKKSDLNTDYMKKFFPEVYNNQIAINNLSVTKVDNPFKPGSKISVKNLIKKIQVDSYGWSPRFPTLEILHGKKGVAAEPFSNLTYATRDLNQLENSVNISLKAGNIKPREANNLIKTIRSTISGKTGDDLREAIISRQINLAKQKDLSFPRIKEIGLDQFKKQVAILGGGDCARGFKSQGGRIEYSKGTLNVDVCFKKGIDRIRKGGVDFTQAEANNFSKLTKGLRAVGASNIMKFGVIPEALFEGALVADKMVSEGDSFMQGIRNSYLSIPFQAMGAMKTYEEGRKDEILAAAPESQRGKVLDVMSMQDTLNKRNELAQDSFGLKKQIEDTDRISDGSFGYVSDSQDLQKRLSDKRMDLQDLYRGDATRAERMLTSSPLDLKIKDQLSMDAYNQAVEKADALRAANIKVSPGTGFGVDTQIKKRMQDEGILKADDVNQYLQYMGDTYGTGYTPLSLGRLFSMFGIQNPKFGFDETGKYNQERGINDVLNYMKMQNIADAGGVANLASGGIAGAKSGPAPESGPTPHGLPNLFKRVRNY